MEDLIKVSLNTRMMLEVLAERSNFDSISEYLEAIVTDPLLCLKIEEYFEDEA